MKLLDIYTAYLTEEEKGPTCIILIVNEGMTFDFKMIDANGYCQNSSARIRGGWGSKASLFDQSKGHWMTVVPSSNT